MQHFGKGAVRVVKNYTKGYSDTQSKVRDATSNDPWGPSGTQMNEIAQMTYNQGDFVEIMEMLDKRLNDKGKNWRHVFKSLTLLDYLLHQGSENVIIYFKDNLYVIKTLKEFQYVDEDGKDQGGNVRAKAKDITSLLQDEGRLRTERRARASMRERMVRGGGAGEEGEFDENAARGGGMGDENGSRRGRQGTDDEMRRAIEESKKSLRQEQMTAEEKDLAQAIKLSEEEEAKRKRGVEESNAKSLFDEANQLPPPVSNNPFPFLDAPPPQQQQFQLQPQFTSIQPQFTSFNPYQQQADMEAEYMRQQQQQAFIQQQQQQQQAQQEEWMRQQQMMQQQQQQEEWMRQQQQQLLPQPTGFGSNNPFAQTQQQQQPPMPAFSPTIHTPPVFNLGGTYENNNSPQPSFQSPPIDQGQNQNPGSQRFKVKVNDGENQKLASLFANRDDGQDTFGNTGALRYGHTAAGLSLVAAQKTGNNPFQRQGQQQNEQPFFNV
ncbi:epsin domain-containing protein [Mycena rebaudengoi]|nr:epsin domain-containing protein [Mycena rebaudengoi]KAJ7236005.1 epsin domain-containing protein [Mycena rebaudengoi]